MKAQKLNDAQKGKLIAQIMTELKLAAFSAGRQFDESVFFNLAFMSDKDLLRTAKMCKVI